MNIIQQLERALILSTSRAEFDAWMDGHGEELLDFIYSATGSSLDGIKFNNFYYKFVAPSIVFRDYRAGTPLTPQFEAFLNVIALAAEKMAQVELHGFASNIVDALPGGPSKSRLKALLSFAVVDDVVRDYLERFPIVLQHLQDSTSALEEGNTRLLIDILIFFHNLAKSKLIEHGRVNVFDDVRALYLNPTLVTTYPFLNHSVLQALVSGKDPFNLLERPVPKDVLRFSGPMTSLFRDINRELLSNPEVNYPRSIFGFSVDGARKYIIEHGRTDFRIPLNSITPEEKVLVYCFLNMKSHFFSSYEVFSFVIDSLADVFAQPDYPPIFIDLGCGPMTSGLALADILCEKTGKPIHLKYVGVDIAPAMLDRSMTFEDCPIFSPESRFIYLKNWRELTGTVMAELGGPNTPVVFNASFLFASVSLDVNDLAQFVLDIAERYATVYFIFQNPDDDRRNEKYEAFKALINYDEILADAREVKYITTGIEIKTVFVRFEILKIK